MDKFSNKYRIASARAEWWDYANKGAYFITICTDKQECFFGEISNKKFFPTELGEIAGNLLTKIPEQFPYAELGPSVVMPNHVHAIVVINPIAETQLIAALPEIQMNDTKSILSPQPAKGGITGMKNPMLNDNLSRIVRWYKGVCSFHMRKIHADFAWQPRFHDVIIKDNDEYLMIEDYIHTNIAEWTKDKFFKRLGI